MKMIDLVLHGFDALKAGKSLNNVAAWKNVQVVGSLLAALLGIAASLGYNFGLTDQQIYGLAAGIAALVNGYLTLATSKKVGIDGRVVQVDSAATELPAIELQSVKSIDSPTTDKGLAESKSSIVGVPEPSGSPGHDFDPVQAICRIQEKDGTDSGWNG